MVNMTAFGTFKSFSMMILFDFEIFFSNIKNDLDIEFFTLCATSRGINYFFSPSNNKNDSKVGGAFILDSFQ